MNGTGPLRQFVVKAARHSSRAAFEYLEQFYARGGWTYRRNADRDASWLSRSTPLVVLILSTSLMIGAVAVLYIGFFAR
jgi:hypothetical protein